MQSIGTYQILGLLLYLSIFIGRYQFWANRSIDNIDQRIPSLAYQFILGNPAHQILNQSFGNTC